MFDFSRVIWKYGHSPVTGLQFGQAPCPGVFSLVSGTGLAASAMSHPRRQSIGDLTPSESYPRFPQSLRKFPEGQKWYQGVMLYPEKSF